MGICKSVMEQTKHNDYETDTDISDAEYQEMTVTPPQHWQEMEKLVGQLQHEFKQVRLEEASLAASCEKYKYNADKAQRNEEKVRIKNRKLVALLKEKENQRNLIQSEVNGLKDELNEQRAELEKARKSGDSLSEENRLIKQEIDELKINLKSSFVTIANLTE